MKLVIEVTNDYDNHFIEWLTQRIQYELLNSVNPKRVRALSVAINELELFKPRFPLKHHKIDLLDSFVTGVLAMECKRLKNHWIIYIPSYLMHPTHFTTICTLCRFINDGRNDIKGYPVFTQTFNRVSTKISSYYNMYLNEFMIM